MSRGQRLRLVALVLSSLAFVANTEACSVRWWLPLALLTLGSPWLVQWVRWRSYRIAWNTTVVAVFGMLLRHLVSRGAPHLLEDGLLLAALCQVHLINNLTDDLRPDLLYFNSFLIAVVTSFLSTDFRYLCLVGLYVPLLCAALQSRAEEEAGATGDRFSLGLPQGLLVLALSALLFVFLPRDFERRGFLFDSWFADRSLYDPEIGFADQVDLEQGATARASDRIVAEVFLERGGPGELPTYWRGATLDHFDGRSWNSTDAGGGRSPWRSVSAAHLQRSSRRPGVRLRVEPRGPLDRTLFAPLGTVSLSVDHAEAFDRLAALPDDTFHARRSHADPARLVYRVWTESPAEARDAIEPDDALRWRTSELFFLQYEAEFLPESARIDAERCVSEVGFDATQRRRALAIAALLESEHGYALPGAPGAAQDLEDFFAGAPAHCEYFATALALMLRSQSIPCRIVTGFHSSEWDGERQALVLRSHHAHAWVEVLDPDTGWWTIDATPAAPDGPRERPGDGWLARLRHGLESFWAGLDGLDEQGRRRFTVLLGPVALGAALLAGLVALLLRRWRSRRRGGPEPVRRYESVLRELELERAAAESPRELLERVRPELTEEALDQLCAATARHEAERYAAAVGCTTPDTRSGRAD